MSNVVETPAPHAEAVIWSRNRRDLMGIIARQIEHRFSGGHSLGRFFLSDEKLKSPKGLVDLDASCLSIKERHTPFPSRTILVLAVMTPQKIRCIILERADRIKDIVEYNLGWFAKDHEIEKVEIEVQGH